VKAYKALRRHAERESGLKTGEPEPDAGRNRRKFSTKGNAKETQTLAKIEKTGKVRPVSVHDRTRSQDKKIQRGKPEAGERALKWAVKTELEKLGPKISRSSGER